MSASALPPRAPIPAPVLTPLLAKGVHRLLPALRRRLGPAMTLTLSPRAVRMVVLGRPDLARAVFASPVDALHAGEGNAILAPVMGEHSVLLLDEAEHARIRRLLMPPFQGAAMRGYESMIDRIARNTLGELPIGVAGPIHPVMSRLTLDVILEVVFGVADPARAARIRPLVDKLVSIDLLVALGWFVERLRGVPPWRGYVRVTRELDAILFDEIRRRRTEPGLATRTDVLSRLVRGDGIPPGEAGLTDAELRDNLVTLLLAGHETTATALAWTCHELARSPRVQERARDAAVGGDPAYLDAVLKEALRLRPVIPNVARQVTRPTRIGEFELPRGMVATPSMVLLHSDPVLWPDPDRFDPDRFLGTAPPPNTWLPFGGGVRRCLGAAFAQMEARVILAELLRHYEIRAEHTAPERTIRRNITLAPGRGGRVVLRRRD